jgi:RNA polymerase sigma-70 factor (ECF subfamily)
VTEEKPTPELTAQAYRHFAPYVRRALSQLGVREADLADVCHEVFMVVHARSDSLDEVVHFDLWLREICRRVSSGYRRRSVNRLEVLAAEPLGPEHERAAGDPWDELGREDLVRHALRELDEESRDLLALHDVGEMPLTELSRLTLHDRKTVRKRLQIARTRLAALMSSSEEPLGERRSQPPLLGPLGVPLNADDVEPLSGMKVLTITRGISIGLFGNVVMTVWPDVASAEALDELLHWGPRMIGACGGRIGYMALVESSVLPPNLAGRRKIVEALDHFGPHVIKYSTVLLGGGSWIAQPIMSGLMVLARPRFPMRFFKSVDAAAAWLANECALGPDGPLAADQLVAAGEYLRDVTRAQFAKETAG